MIDRKAYRPMMLALVLSACAALAEAQYSPIYTFNSSYDGCCAYYADLLAQGTDGNLHGTMPVGTHVAFYGSWFDYTIGGAVAIHGLNSSTQPQNAYAD